MLHNVSPKTILNHQRDFTSSFIICLKGSIFNKNMLDSKIFLLENKLSFVFKNFSFDLLLQSTLRTFINSTKFKILRTLTEIPL